MLMGLWVLWLESSEATINKKYLQEYTAMQWITYLFNDLTNVLEEATALKFSSPEIQYFLWNIKKAK